MLYNKILILPALRVAQRVIEDVVKELGYLTLGTLELKRLGERLQAQTQMLPNARTSTFRHRISRSSQHWTDWGP